jgi:hypothetical protein
MSAVEEKIFLLLFCFDTLFHYVAKAGLKLVILVSYPMMQLQLFTTMLG